MTLEKAIALAEEMAKERGRDCIEDEMIQVFAKSILKLEEALQQCVEWANAYPVDIFPQPTPEQVDAVCKTLGFRIDSISAMVLRNYTKRIGEIAHEALSR